jgi:transposase
MTKIYQLGTPPKQALWVETYLAPPPPPQGKIIGLDCHPDTFTAAVFEGQTPHDARKVGSRENLGLQALLGWAAKEFGPQDLFVLEAGSNSFELCTRLHALGLRAVVLESCHVGKHAKTYADNDKMAAARIALVYLAGNAPCVWVPDEPSRQRRELLHAYGKAVADHTAASNSLRAYLNGNAVRAARRNLELESTRQWILKQRDWSPMQREILAEHFGDLEASKERRKRLYRLIAAEVSVEPMMLRSMKALGVGKKGRGDNPTISSSEALRPFSAIAAPRPGANGAGNSSPEKQPQCRRRRRGSQSPGPGLAHALGQPPEVAPENKGMTTARKVKPSTVGTATETLLPA